MSRTVILVEGESDRAALQAAAVALRRPLSAEIVVMYGITNLLRHLKEHAADRVVVLYDAPEHHRVERALAHSSAQPSALFACERDLEEELIRAAGADRVLAVIEAEGDLPAWRALRGQPFHREHPVEEVLHRFMGSIGGRKLRYASALVAILRPDELPRPLVEVIQAASESR